MVHDTAKLGDELSKLLQWDRMMVDGVIDTITKSNNPMEIDEIIQNFMGDQPAAIQLIRDYLAAKQKQASKSPAAASALSNASMGSATCSQTQPSKESISSAQDGWKQYNKAAADGLGYVAPNAGNCSSKAKSSKETTAAATTTPPEPAPQEGPAKVLGMFKQGGRLKTPAGSGRPKGGRRDDVMLAAAAALERKVVNCLSCGKVYDCRNVTEDIKKFVDSGGWCTFCGQHVSLTYKDRNEAQQHAEASAAAATAAAAGPDAEAVAAAVAFKNRLVEYDRNAAQRTTVIDDQSDYFEIDSNSWLTDKERQELRQRRQLEAEAEAAMRKRVTVTIDLIGRKVVVASDQPVSAATAFEVGDAPSTTAPAAGATASSAAARAAAAVPGAAGSDGRPRSGPEELARAARMLRNMKISINPNINTERPVFQQIATTSDVAATAPPAAASSQAGKGPAHKGRPERAQADTRDQQRKRSGCSTASHAAGYSSRLQYNLTDEFDAFNAEVLYEDVSAAMAAASEQEVFDLCPPSFSGMAPLSAAALRPARQGNTNAVQQQQPQQQPAQLPPGMVLLKGWLTLEQQVDIVQMLRELGMGPGGFYTPSHLDGAQLHLKMMCLGWHWEVRSHTYERVRASHDGAVPPPIPTQLLSLAQAALAAAQRSSSCKLPPLQPDVCLVNFYEKTGRLGMHQDKDEGQDSLKRGLPVVSFSIGDAAEFMFGTSYDEASASTVRLESGDVLIFGGPSRMVYHAVPKIYHGTAPAELIKRTNLRPGRINLTFRQT